MFFKPSMVHRALYNDMNNCENVTSATEKNENMENVMGSNTARNKSRVIFQRVDKGS